MRIAFLGTPQIAATVLSDLLDAGVNISAVITQPNRPAGRGGKETESAIKTLAVEKYLDTFQPETKDELVAAIKDINPDICIVAAYGMMIPNEALEIPKYGMINFHPSLLPLLRGPSPIPMAIMCGHKETGVSIIQVAEEMDAGDILSQEITKLNGTETTPSLSEDLAHLGAKMILELLPKVETNKVTAVKQEEKDATYSHIIKKTDGEIILHKYQAQNIEQAARAFTPWPGIYTTWNGKKIDFYDVSVPKGTDPMEGLSLKAGEVGMYENKIAIGTAKGIILIGSLKIEGKNIVTATQFASGYQNFIGTKLA